MKKIFLLSLSIFAFLGLFAQKQTITVLDQILFYDGYNTLEKLGDEVVPVPEGVIRHSTSLCATKLTDSQLSLFGNEITMKVLIKAACDNYDRLGHVNLALVPKGSETYKPAEVDRYEIGRFITPFMYMGLKPDTVPYLYDISYLKHVFKDKNLLDTYDFWMELEVFGVPYAANEQVIGCAGRSDVFYGTLSFTTSNAIPVQEGNVLKPLLINYRFNNYQEGASDELGKTVKTVEFSIDRDLPNSQLVLITSNHGAETIKAEEYNRRWHHVYFDDKHILEYVPGRESCESFRKYNTQPNGIYGEGIKTPEQWQAFSNWCPGDVIDTRRIQLGELKAGNHKFVIEVPQAEFWGKNGSGTDGYFPLSLYFLSTVSSTTSVETIHADDVITLFPNPTQDVVTIETDLEPQKIILFNSLGQQVFETSFTRTLDISHLSAGVYWLTFDTGNKFTQKIIKL